MMRRGRVFAAALVVLVIGLALAMLGGGGRTSALPVAHPVWNDAQLISAGTTPPTEAQCFSAGRRCFTPQSLQAAYNVGPLYASGLDGSGQTIAIVDAYGSDTMAHDLHVFDQAFGLQPMCGEEGVTCTSGMPRFSELALQGSPATKPNPNPGKQEDRSAWALEVALDVETSHAIA